jgi:hypothetical protein
LSKILFLLFLTLLCAFFIISGIVKNEEAKWEKYKADHNCKVVRQVESIYADVKPVSIWLCDDNEEYITP